MQPIALAIIGYGVMGERLLRAALEYQDAPVKLVGVWDPSARRDAAPRRAVSLRSGAWSRRRRRSRLAIASTLPRRPPAISTMPARRLRGTRPVLCEKPLAVDLQAARGFVESSEADGARAAINFPFASSPGVEQLRSLDRGRVRSARSGSCGSRSPLPSGRGSGRRPPRGWLDRRAQGGFTREVVSHFVFLTHRLLGAPRLESGSATYPGGEASETAMHASMTAGGVPVTIRGTVGQTELPDHNLWVLDGANGSVRLRDWAIAERLGEDGVWRSAPDAMPNEKLRPLVLRRQLDKVARMTRGEAQDLATLREALEVQEIIETILAAR